ncbi:OpgC domain-containing protein [Paracoccus sp. p4-l81]|uniref:OpgC domain-containing protein n=1 Tax=unclassified Paracoccus (in: a-proteobacteria) TaxID=2688777 RepID=UPI0035B8EF6B
MNRSITLDMLRGFALVCIMLDHLPVGVLSAATLSSWALFDAAELFVLLSGFLVGIVWRGIEARHGTSVARRRFARRAFEVWRALVLGAVAMALVSRALFELGLNHTTVWSAYAQWIIDNPLGYVGAVGTMWMQPNLVDVLALYVIFLASVPVTVPLILRWPVPAALVSLLIWLNAPALNALIPNHRDGGLLFNPFGWQMLFFTGVAMGLWRLQIMAALRPWGSVLTPIAVVIWLFGGAFSLAGALGPVAQPVHAWLAWVHGSVDKWSLDGARYLGILSAAWLVVGPLAGPLARASATGLGRALQTIGRAGLWAFVLGVLLSVIGDAFQMNPADQGWLHKLAVDLWAMLALWLGSAVWMDYGAPRQAARKRARLQALAGS